MREASGRVPRAAGWLAGGLLLALGACGPGERDEAVESARLFVEGLLASARGAASLRGSFEALCPEGQRALRARARRAEGLAGRRFEPWEMLVPGRAKVAGPLDWERASLALRASGEAFVEVPLPGRSAREPALRLRMDRADGRWCVAALAEPVPDAGP